MSGTIDVDPATSIVANQTVQASVAYTQQDDGLDPLRRWHGNVFINPPGGLVREFWTRLMQEWFVGNIRQAVWIGYSLQQLQQLQLISEGAWTPLDFPICFPKRRIAFNPIAGQPAAAPGHANYVAYLPDKNDPASPERFVSNFQQFGRCLVNGWD